MRNINLVMLGLAGAALLPLAANATIVGSPHDFSAKSWNTRAGLCNPCHQVHNTDINQLAPLWAHASTSGPFKQYASSTMQASVGQPDGASKACLSCHDGSVAINDYGGSVQGGTREVIAPGTPASIGYGGEMRNHHPISFTYDPALTKLDTFLNDPTTTQVPLMGNQTIDKAMLQNGKLQCSSCHDVHKQKGVASSSTIMLVIGGSAGAGSKLCLTCHIK